MQNKPTSVTILLSVFLALVLTGWSALPESEWLDDYARSKGFMLTEVGMHIGKFLPELNDDNRIPMLIQLLSKTGIPSANLDATDYDAAAAALKLLSFIKHPELLEIASPHLSSANRSVRRNAAQALATNGSDEAVLLLEQTFKKEVAAFVAKPQESAPSQFDVFNYLRCLAIIGTPKAKAAFERSSKIALSASATKSLQVQGEMKKSVALLEVELEKPKETPIPDRSSPEITEQSTLKSAPSINPETKSQSQPTSNIPLVAGILLLIAIAGFVFYRHKP